MLTRKYRKKAGQYITAVQLNLQTDGFRYRKWGAEQQCSSGDWLVDNDGDCYTVSDHSFRATYTEVAPGRYEKSAPVWASRAAAGGVVETSEGSTAYRQGDYLVSNNANGSDAYAVGREMFEQMYEIDE